MSDQDFEHMVIKSFGIDAPTATECHDCGMRHYPYRDCPPVLPLDTATWGYVT